jgi:hypothetical protein
VSTYIDECIQINLSVFLGHCCACLGVCIEMRRPDQMMLIS